MYKVKWSSLMSMPKECVYSLVCHASKRVLVGYTEDLIGALYRIYKDLETPKYSLLKIDIDDVEIEVLEVGIQSKTDKKIRTDYWVSDYLSKGYTLYSPSNLVKYKVYTDVIVHRATTLLVVYLKDKRCNKVVVGLFRSKKLMDEFVDKYYPNMKCSGIYYADNRYTKAYRDNNNDNKWNITR